MSLLDSIQSPADLRTLKPEGLKQLAQELRADVIQQVSKTGGHLGASLGVIELTIALHYLFDTPHDRLIWDVGHQTYPHKILTGRRDKMQTLRQGGGLSGFAKRSESPYDSFGAGHSSTSISAGLGMAVASSLNDEDHQVVAIIGDGAMSAGLAYEAMNNAGSTPQKLIVILNDNDMSIAPPVGALSAYLSRFLTSSSFLGLRNMGKTLAHNLPDPLGNLVARAEEGARTIFTGGNFFESLGFYYVGPIDGHNLDHLLPVLQNIRDSKDKRPVLIHVKTQKGKGYQPAEASKDKYHGVSKFDVDTGTQKKSNSTTPSYTKVFSDALVEQAQKDDKIVAITAAMPSGTGLDAFAQQFPERFFDVGIAEQHAVTFAAGLACEGIKPFVTIYSTFLQRAYDQIVHDVALQSLPVRFAIDRAGFVGADGATHAGSFDISYLCTLPNMVVMAPSNGAELVRMVQTAVTINDRPCAFRYPRGQAHAPTSLTSKVAPLEIGKGYILKEGKQVAFLNFGGRLDTVTQAVQIMEKQGLSPTIADARFAKPLDTELIKNLVSRHKILVTLEEGAIGGFSTQVLTFLAQEDLLHKIRVVPLFFPDIFQDHDTPDKQYEKASLTASKIAQQILCLMREK